MKEVKKKKKKKIDKYLDFARELKKLRNLKVTRIPMAVAGDCGTWKWKWRSEKTCYSDVSERLPIKSVMKHFQEYNKEIKDSAENQVFSKCWLW